VNEDERIKEGGSWVLVWDVRKSQKAQLKSLKKTKRWERIVKEEWVRLLWDP